MKQTKRNWIQKLPTWLLKLAALGGTALLGLFLVAILARSFAQFVLVDAMGMPEEHPVVALLFKDRKTNAMDESEPTFSENGLVRAVEKYTAAVRYAEDGIEQAVSDYTLGRTFFTKLVNRTEHAVGYDLNSFDDTSILLEKDYCYALEDVLTESEIESQTKIVRQFAEVVESRGIPFLYAMIPNKVCIDTDWISGTLDYSEQNRIREVESLRAQGVDVFDLTDVLHAEGLTHREMFFPTDHHWTPATGLWAADRIAAYVDEAYGVSFDRSVLKPEQYSVDVYEDVFLGSAGQKVTESKIQPDDFALYRPNFDTDLYVFIQQFSNKEPFVDARGDFLLQYDMYYLEIFAPILESDIYSTYLYANPGKIRIKNYRNLEGPKVLLIGDSYDNVLIPFLAQAAGETIALDCRFADVEELHSTILAEEIDLVLTTVSDLARLLP